MHTRRLMTMGLVLALSVTAWAQGTVIAKAADGKAGVRDLRLMRSAKGELLLVYADGPKVLAMRSTDGGKSWTDLAGKPGASTLAEEANGVDAWLDDDTVYVAFTTRNKVEVMKLTRGGDGWTASAAKTLDTGLRMSDPAICRDASGDVWVAYYFGGHDALEGIRVSRTSGGEKFGERTGCHNITYGFSSSVQRLAVWHGRPVLFYSGGSTWESVQIYRSVFDGKRWSLPAVGIGECARSPGSFCVSVDDADTITVAWRTFPTLQFVRYRRCDASGKWDPQATTLEAKGRYSTPALISDGKHTWCLWGRTSSDELVRAALGGKGASPRKLGADAVLAGGRCFVPRRVAADGGTVPVVCASGGTGRQARTQIVFRALDLNAPAK